MRDEDQKATTAKAKALFSPIRLVPREILHPIIMSEFPAIQRLQKRMRTPALDFYFLWISGVGSHLFYMIALPILFWMGFGRFARQLTLLMAAGLYACNIVKDFFCLPRPLSPPIVKLSSDESLKLEYGFPSAHSVNSLNLPLFAYLYLLNAYDYNLGFWPTVLGALFCAFFTGNIAFARIYCGMHSLTDVIGGLVVGSCVLAFFARYYEVIDAMMFSGPLVLPVSLAICIALIIAYPDPVDPTPSFDDTVSFLSVGVGITWAAYLFSLSPLSDPYPFPATIPYSYEKLGLFVTLLRVVIGIAVILVWRVVSKKLCHIIFPPLFRLFHFPARKFFLPARWYSRVETSIRLSPSVLRLPDEEKKAKERAISQAVKDIKFHEKTEGDADVNTVLAFHRLPRYDIDVLTRVIVYLGIGWWACMGIPLVFAYLHLA